MENIVERIYGTTLVHFIIFSPKTPDASKQIVTLERAERILHEIADFDSKQYPRDKVLAFGVSCDGIDYDAVQSLQNGILAIRDRIKTFAFIDKAKRNTLCVTQMCEFRYGAENSQLSLEATTDVVIRGISLLEPRDRVKSYVRVKTSKEYGKTQAIFMQMIERLIEQSQGKLTYAEVQEYLEGKELTLKEALENGLIQGHYEDPVSFFAKYYGEELEIVR